LSNSKSSRPKRRAKHPVAKPSRLTEHRVELKSKPRSVERRSIPLDETRQPRQEARNAPQAQVFYNPLKFNQKNFENFNGAPPAPLACST
jgi:hypothetical protein